VLLTFGEEAYYLYGASATEKDNVYASYLVQFEMMNIARGAGATRYDMGGIPCDPQENHTLWGVYQFKKKFGGEQKRFAGAYEKDLRPVQARVVRAGIRGYYALQKLRGKSSGPLGG
jgi:lipid II:glycine glycyltransferase (peptidoglycan interpeptide bridge formation enzyme)